MSWIRKNQRLVILAALSIVALVAIMSANVSTHKSNHAPETKQGQISQAEVKLLKDTLDIYYLNHHGYPTSLASLREDIKSDPSDSYKMTADEYDKDIKDIPSLKYSVRGDRTAYKVTYKSESGVIQNETGSYNKDYL